MSGQRPPLELLIQIEGDLSSDLLTELAGFETHPVAGGTVLHGQVPDASALWGILHRLRRASLEIRSVEHLITLPPAEHPLSASAPRTWPERLVRIEVEGHAAGVVSDAVVCDAVFPTPPSTTLVMRISSDEELFAVLARLEGLALDVREIRIV